MITVNITILYIVKTDAIDLFIIHVIHNVAI